MVLNKIPIETKMAVQSAIDCTACFWFKIKYSVVRAAAVVRGYAAVFILRV